MSYKKFNQGDIFYNVIKTNPRYEFKIWNGKIYLNNGIGQAVLNDVKIGTAAESAE